MNKAQMNHDPERRSGPSPPAWEKNRSRFFRQVICDAQLELSRLESVFKIMEVALLTAMGSLGIKSGFNSRLNPDDESVQIVDRNMDTGTIAFVKDNFQRIAHHYFPIADPSAQSFRVTIQKITKDPRAGDPLNTSHLRILIWWRMGHRLMGLLGLGEKINADTFTESEINFLYSLADHMMVAMKGISSKSIIHTLENALDQAKQRVADTTANTLATKKELEETLFRLSGFNDIFHELSDIKESAKLIDAFLLVLLGIFSTSSGLIFHWEQTTGEIYTTARGSSRSSVQATDSAGVRKILGDLFNLGQLPKIGSMQAVIVPSEQLNRMAPMISNSHITLLFRIDETTKGVLCLGKRLVQTQYDSREQELLLAFAHNFLVFLKNSRSFETIQRLHVEQERQYKELENTLQELTSCQTTIDGMEKAGERIRAAMAKAMARTKRASLTDIAIIIIAGALLGLAYNFASPSGIPIIPEIWRHAPSQKINVFDAKTMVKNNNAILVDARPAEFYNQQHIDGAVNLPLALFDFVYMMRFNRLDTQRPMIVYGRTISRHYDETIAYKLAERGHHKVYVLPGGLKTWQAKP